MGSHFSATPKMKSAVSAITTAGVACRPAKPASPPRRTFPHGARRAKVPMIDPKQKASSVAVPASSSVQGSA